MLDYDWDKSAGQWICGTAHAIRKLFGAKLLRAGLTFRQWEVLAWLSVTGKYGSQSNLADALGIEPHTLAGVVTRMQRDGLLDRRSCDKDRRKNLIQPTPKAEELWNRVSIISHSIRDQAVQGFTDEELANLKDYCERIQVNLGAIQITPTRSEAAALDGLSNRVFQPAE